MTVSNAIKTLRVKHGYTQEQLAILCDVSRQAVTKWESGMNLPDIEKIIQLSNIFQVSVDDLLKSSHPATKAAASSPIARPDYVENEKIVNYALKIAMSKDDPEDEIDSFISIIGDQIGCDRIYIFEQSANGSFRNSFEWCDKGISPQKEYLQTVPLADITPWITAFSVGEYIFIEDVDQIADTEPEIFRWLKPQGIQSLLAYPLFGGRMFFGVDNPAKAFITQTSSLMEIMIHFVESMLQRRDLIHELRMETLQSKQITEMNKGVRYRANLVTGDVQIDKNQSANLGYQFNFTNTSQVRDYVESHPECRDHLMLDGFQRAIETKENQSIEFLSYIDGDRIRWNRVSISPFVDNTGTVLQLYGMIQDCSEKHQIIERYNNYITHLAGGLHICYLSDPIHLEFVSDSFCSFLGYTREEFNEAAGSKYVNIIVEEDRAVFAGYIKRLSSTPGIESCEYRLIKKDGSIVQVIDTMESIADSNGTIYGYAYVLDKSNLQAMFDMAKENEKRQLEVIHKQYEVLETLGRDYLNLFRVWLDEDKAQIVYLNGYVTKGMDKNSAEYIPYYRLCKQYVQDRVHPEDRNRMLEAMHPDVVRKAFEKDDEYIVVYRALENKETHYYQLKYSRLDNHDGSTDIRFVAGFKCVDKVIEAERKQKEQLQNRLNIIHAILQTFTCGYHIDYQEDTFTELSCTNDSIRKIIGINGKVSESMKRWMIQFSDKNAAARIYDFLNISTLNERLNGQRYIAAQLPVNEFGWFEINLLVVDYDENGVVNHCVFAARDITAEKQQAEEWLRSIGAANRRERAAMQYAYVDSLTKVLNRNAFDRDYALLNDYTQIGFVYCDLNNLKETNDTMGHSKGDQLLVDFSNQLKEHFSVDCIYRIGGDEFVCMIGSLDSTKFAERVKNFADSVNKNGNIVSIGDSYGTPDEKETLLREAELKMYAMKCALRKKTIQ